MTSRSILLRLLIVAAVTIGVTLTVAGLTLENIFERHLEQRVAQELEVKWQELAAAFEIDDDKSPSLGKQLSDPRYEQPYAGAYWRVTEKDASVLRSRSLWDEDIAPAHEPEPEPGIPVERKGPNQSTLYLLERPVTLSVDDAQRTFTLGVALDHADIEALRASFHSDVLAALGLIGIILLLGSWLQMSFGLRPLKRLKAQLESVRRGAKTRLEGDYPGEIAPLVQDLNILIDRQEDSVARARKRAGDLAHGLKTPLTILSGDARRLEEKGLAELAQSLRAQIDAMLGHVQRELARARVHGATSAAGTLTDAGRTIDKLFALMRRMPRGDALTFQNMLPEGLRIRMDADDFGEVAGNLLDNARKHAASRVAVRAEIEGAVARLYFEDDGPGIAAHKRERLMRRGERGQEDGDGSGLGLSIAADVLDLYQASLRFESVESGGCSASFSTAGWIEAESGAPPQAARGASKPAPASAR